MLLSPFSSLLGEAETIVTIFKNNIGHLRHNHHGRPNHNVEEIAMDI